MAVLSDDMGGITAYAAAVNRGYTGTKEEFEQLMYSYTEVAERAEAAAGNAHESEENSIEAKDIAVNAKNEAVSARDAAISARDASISAKNNSESARDVAISAKDDTLAAKDAVMSAKNSIDETSANFSDEVTAAISDVNAAGRNQKELAKTHAIDSEAWAVGQREGADVGVSDTTYHNNSKYYAEQSELAKSETETARDTAITAKNNAVSAKNEAETAKGEAQDIVDGINAKSEQIDQNAEDITALQTAIVTKAEVDGNYEDMTVGTAEQLIGEVVSEDSVPYIIRKSLADGSDRLYNQIVGGTVNWNQLIQNGNFSNGNNRWTVYMATVTYGNNIATIVTADSVDINSGGSLYQNVISMLANHKYIVSATIKGDGEHRVALRADGGLIFDTITNISSDFKTFVGVAAGASGYSRGRVIVTAYGPSMTIYVKNVILFDLTAMLGSTIADYIYTLEQTTAGAGVAFFKSLFPKNYYEYNSGELVNVSGLSEHKMVGFNLFDKNTVLNGYVINDSTGDAIPVSAGKVTDYISVIPNQTYYIKSDQASGAWGAWYDADKNYISGIVGYIKDGGNVNKLHTAPADARYIRLTCFYNNSGDLDTFCINLSDPAKNGTYEPYKAHSYPLDSTLTLRGVFKLDANNNFYADGDTYDADGTVTRRYGVVDLGTLIWTKSTDYANPIFYASISDIISGVQDKKLVCSKYDYVVGLSAGTVADYTTPVIGTPTANTQVIVRDPNYDNSDGATFKAAMSGVYLVYRLATPITEQAQSFTNPQIVDGDGTEEYVTNSIVLVGHVTKYANNLRAKLEMAPNSPNGDGDYVVRQANGENEYVPLAPILSTKADVTDLLKAFPADVATGAVASFSDGANLPLKSLVVNIDPVQDLHGYDNPWPAGGGKNLLDVTKAESSSFTRSGETFTNTNVDSRTAFMPQVQLFNGNTRIREIITASSADDRKYITFTVGDDEPVTRVGLKHNGSTLDLFISIPWTSKGTYTLSLKVVSNNPSVVGGLVLTDIMIASGDYYAPYVPYSNICPISGWSEVNMQRTGKNFADIYGVSAIGITNQTSARQLTNSYGTTINSIDYSGEIVITQSSIGDASTPTNLRNGYFAIGIKGLIVNRRYKFVADVEFTNKLINTTVLSGSWNGENLVGREVVDGKIIIPFTVIPKNTNEYIEIRVCGASLKMRNIMVIEETETDTDYEPYSGTSLNIALGQTVYGGKLDVISGEQMTGRVMVDLGTLAWQYQSVQNRFYAKLPANAVLSDSDTVLSDIICSVYKNISFRTLTNGSDNNVISAIKTTDNYITVRDTAYNDATAFASAVSGQSVVFPIEPTTIQLTPHEVTALLGYNNVWADTGDSMVEYRADPTLYIQRKIAEALANISEG